MPLACQTAFSDAQLLEATDDLAGSDWVLQAVPTARKRPSVGARHRDSPCIMPEMLSEEADETPDEVPIRHARRESPV